MHSKPNQQSRKNRNTRKVARKKSTQFIQPKEGSEDSFLQPNAMLQARKDGSLPLGIQSKMEHSMEEDFSGVQIHENSSEALDMNAMAFTKGEHVHFAPGEYQPHTNSGQELIGHEFAHVKQQRQGRVGASIQAKGRLMNTDSALESEADKMGRRSVFEPVQLKSAALGLRSSMQPKKPASGQVVQMKPYTDYGEFKTTTYSDYLDYGVTIGLEFHPNTKVDATKIGLSQTVKGQANGNNDLFSPTRVNRQTGNGTYIDRVDPRNNPIYGGQQLGTKDKLEKTATTGGNYKLGYRKKDTAGKWIKDPAYLSDQPTMPGSGNNSHQKFETAALGLEGTQKDMYFGSVNWGWEKDAKGVFKRLPITLATSGDMPTAGFLSAAKKWNDATSLGTIKTTRALTNVYDASYSKVIFQLAKNTVVTWKDAAYSHNGISYQGIDATVGKVVKTGRVKTADLVDVADGDATQNLPIPWKGTVNASYLATLRQGKSASSATLADLPNGTKLTVINDTSGWLKVHLDPTQKGIVLNGLGKKAIDVASLLRGYISKELVKK